MCRWEGTPPKTPGEKGDALFEKSKADAARMLERLKAGRDESLERIRWMVEREIAQRPKGGETLAGLVRLFGELQLKIALALEEDGDGRRESGADGAASDTGADGFLF